MYVILYVLRISGSMKIYCIQNVLRWNLICMITCQQIFCCHSVLLQSLKTALDMHSIQYTYQRSTDKPDQIRWERLTNKQQWPSQQEHQSNSAFQRRPAYNVSWFNIPLNCVPGKMGWSQDLTSRFKSRAFRTITATHRHTIFLFQVLMLLEIAQQFLCY